MTPGIAIRKFCVSCVGSYSEVYRCQGNRLLSGESCVFYPFRMGKGRPKLRIIRLFCLHCCCGNPVTVRACKSETCLLFKYRFGKNPDSKHKGNIASLQKAQNSMAGTPQGESESTIEEGLVG